MKLSLQGDWCIYYFPFVDECLPPTHLVSISLSLFVSLLKKQKQISNLGRCASYNRSRLNVFFSCELEYFFSLKKVMIQCHFCLLEFLSLSDISFLLLPVGAAFSRWFLNSFSHFLSMKFSFFAFIFLLTFFYSCLHFSCKYFFFLEIFCILEIMLFQINVIRFR